MPLSDSSITPINTGLPTFTIKAGGQALNQTYQVISLSIWKEVNRISYARIILHDGDPANQDFELSTASEFKHGSEVEILGGFDSDESSLFKGIITKHTIKAQRDKAPVLCVELRDESVKLCVGRKNAYFLDATDGDIIGDIIQAHGLQSDVESMSTPQPGMVQFNSTDWDFILSRAEKNGKIVLIDEGAVTIKTPDLSGSPVVTLAYGQNVYSLESEMDARHQLSSSKSSAWDFSTQEISESEGKDPKLGKQGKVSEKDLADVVGLESYDLFHTGRVGTEELQAWADAKLLKSRLAKVQGKVTIQGNSDVNPGEALELQGFGDVFNGTHFISGVNHQFVSNNWESHIQFGMDPCWFTSDNDITERPASGLLPGVNGLQVGVVIALEGDPDGESRIQVRMPIVSSEEEGIWARVARLDAGENRGVIFNPDIGDEVVLGFLNDDPRDAIVLGMLHSTAKPTPLEATDDNFEKGIFSKGEIKLLFNDETNVFSIETPEGNVVKLSEEDGGILIEDQNGNKMEMTSDGINLESAGDVNITASGDVNIEGANVNLVASTALLAEGGTGAELTSGASTSISGAIVEIN